MVLGGAFVKRVLFIVVGLAVTLFCAIASADSQKDNNLLYRAIFGDGGRLCQVIEETQTRRESAPPTTRVVSPTEPYQGFGMSRAVFGFRLGGFYVTDAYGKEPDPDASFGLLFRTPLSRHMYRVGRIEIAFDTNVYKMKHDYSSPITDFYERYYEVTLSYLGYLPGYNVAPNIYWGIGFGYGNNSMTVKVGSSTSSDDWDSPIIVLRLGWDTLEGFFFEISYRWMLDDDDIYIQSLFQVAIGLYF